MKKSYFLLLFFLATTIFYAQNIPIKIKSSPVYEEEKWNYSLAFSLDDGAGGLVNGQIHSKLNGIVKGYRIEHYDADLKLINETFYELKLGKITDAFMNNGELTLVEFLFNKENKSYDYVVTTSPIDNFNFTSEVLKSFSAKEMDISITDKRFMSNYTLNGQSMASEIDQYLTEQQYRTITGRQKKTDLYFVNVYNKDFNLVLDKEVQLKEKEFVKFIEIDQETGTVYLLTQNCDKEFRDKETQQPERILYQVSLSGVKSHKLSLEGDCMAKFKLIVNNDRLTLFGFYLDESEKYVSGITNYNIDSETLAVKNKVVNPFGEQFVKEVQKERKAHEMYLEGKALNRSYYFYKNQGKGYTNYHWFYETGLLRSSYTFGNNNTYLVADDNSIYWIAEALSIDTYRSGSKGKAKNSFFYGDIVVAKINAEGKMEWSKVIHKGQGGGELEFGVNKFSSYKAVLHNNAPLLFLNAHDLETATAKEVQFKKYTIQDSNLYAVQVTSDGDFVVDEVFNFEEVDEIMLTPSAGWIIDNGKRVIMEGGKYGRKKKQLFEFSF